MPPQMKSVFSSHIASIGYDPSGELHVVFKDGRAGIYSGVPSDIGEAVMNAPSVGSALHQTVRGKYAFSYV